MTNKPKDGEQPEIDAEAWARFEKAVDVVARAPPQHRTAKPKEASQKSSALKGKGRTPKKGA